MIIRRVPAFLHIPKTAGSTLTYLLRRSFGIRHVDVDPLDGHSGAVRASDLLVARRSHPFGIVSMAGHGFRPEIDMSSSGIEPVYYTLLREPVKRSISWYIYRVLKRGVPESDPMQYFSKAGVQNFQTKRIAGEANLDRAIEIIETRFRFVGLTERFDESMRMLREAFPGWGIDIRYRSQNAIGDTPLKRKLLENRRLIELIEQSNQIDAALYDYVEKRFVSALAGGEETGGLSLDGHVPSLRVGMNRVARNLVYKPTVFMARLMR